MTTLGRHAYEQHTRRDDEAPPWEWLAPCQQRRWQNTAAAVAIAVSPETEMLRAECEQLRAETAKLRTAAADLADLRAFASEALSEFSEQSDHRPGRTAIISGDTWDRWLKIAADLGIEAL